MAKVETVPSVEILRMLPVLVATKSVPLELIAKALGFCGFRSANVLTAPCGVTFEMVPEPKLAV